MANQRLSKLCGETREIALDLNNLLTLILGHLEFVADGLGQASPLLDSLKQIEDGADAAVELVQHLLLACQRPAARNGPLAE